LIPGGKDIAVKFEERLDYVKAVIKAKVNESKL